MPTSDGASWCGADRQHDAPSLAGRSAPHQHSQAPIVHSTVGVAAGQDQSTLPELMALDAMREGYEVYPVVDAIAGTFGEAHRAGLERVTQAGAQPISWVSLAGELQRDWAQVETVSGVVEILFTDRLSTA